MTRYTYVFFGGGASAILFSLGLICKFVAGASVNSFHDLRFTLNRKRRKLKKQIFHSAKDDAGCRGESRPAGRWSLDEVARKAGLSGKDL